MPNAADRPREMRLRTDNRVSSVEAIGTLARPAFPEGWPQNPD